MFVGITRAQQELQISTARYRDFRGQRKLTIPSSFLMELPRGEMEIDLAGTEGRGRTTFVCDQSDHSQIGPDEQWHETEHVEGHGDAYAIECHDDAGVAMQEDAQASVHGPPDHGGGLGQRRRTHAPGRSQCFLPGYASAACVLWSGPDCCPQRAHGIARRPSISRRRWAARSCPWRKDRCGRLGRSASCGAVAYHFIPIGPRSIPSRCSRAETRPRRHRPPRRVNRPVRATSASSEDPW